MGESFIQEDLLKANRTIENVSPAGVTPLTDQIYEIHKRVLQWAPKLMANNKKVVVTIATDGLPTDSSGTAGRNQRILFIKALEKLLRLPVWLVIRLCTNDKKVVSFYNELDRLLEMNVDVLDDLNEEAKEIRKHNKWLNYTLPLHRCREMGFKHRLFDLVDERKLTLSELRDYCILLFGKDQLDGISDPEENMRSFLSELKRGEISKSNTPQWNVLKKKRTALVDVKKVLKEYGKGNKFFPSLICCF